MQFNSFVLLILVAVLVMGQVGTIRFGRLLAPSRTGLLVDYSHKLVHLDYPKQLRIELPSFKSDGRKFARSESTRKIETRKVEDKVREMSDSILAAAEKKTDEKETGQIEGGPQDPQSTDVKKFPQQQASETVSATAGRTESDASRRANNHILYFIAASICLFFSA